MALPFLAENLWTSGREPMDMLPFLDVVPNGLAAAIDPGTPHSGPARRLLDGGVTAFAVVVVRTLVLPPCSQ